MTSHDCVSAVRRLYGLRRVGHAGTLDPAATGVLVLCLGRATRLLEYLTGGQKSYHGEVVFGVTTDSYDADGAVLAERDAGHLTREAIEAALPALTGEIQQQPPMVSAKKVGGRKLVDLHRRGQSLEVQAVPVTVYRLTLTSFTPGTHPRASLEVDCGAGTYIRSLAHDLGAALGVGAHLAALVRTRVGAHDLAQAVTIAELGELSPEARRTRLLPPEAAVAALPRV
ncbi:MAG: tRNA pseudouridine(55) synthase TruB, partial [Armatimonadetes bacterium]|nr:tRNA pseudouridine(55) synthase TruB [Armatimonadota bacterium]